jgi:transcriptional regulator with XRE-family HTH domain
MLKTVFTAEHKIITTRLSELRTRAGLSQRDLAERLAVPQAFVSKIETGERKLDLVEYIVVCKAIGASPEEAASVIADVSRETVLLDLS